MLPALLATAVGLCVYVPISLGLAMSFFPTFYAGFIKSRKK